MIRNRGPKKNDASIGTPLTLGMRPFILPEAKDVTLDGAADVALLGISDLYGPLSGGH